MTQYRRHSIVASLSAILIATMVLCPLMGPDEAGWAASSSEVSAASEAPADTSSALVCCVAVTVEAARDDDLLLSDVEHALTALWSASVSDRVRRAAQYHRSHPKPSPAPPLFLQHASFLL